MLRHTRRGTCRRSLGHRLTSPKQPVAEGLHRPAHAIRDHYRRSAAHSIQPMQRRLTTQDLTWLLDLNANNRLDLEPRYQRRSVWTRQDRQFFLDTIFNGYPSPALFLHKDLDDYGNATYHVVDGKQRIETILMFVRDELPISRSFGDAALNGKRWKDLVDNRELKKDFYDYQFTVEMLDTIETTIVNEVFSRLNKNSTKLTAQELRHARFDGWFISRVEQEAEAPLWREIKLATAPRIRRMQDIQFLSELMFLLIHRQIAGFDQDRLNEDYARYDQPDELDPPFDTEQFNTDFARLAGYVGDLEGQHKVVTTYATALSHLYSLWAYLALLPQLPELDAFAAQYGSFMNEVLMLHEEDVFGVEARDETFYGAVVEYFLASRGASTDLSPRMRRQGALAQALNPGAGHT